MKKAEEYRAHAEECRRLAAAARDIKATEQLTKMAETWESLAMDREAQVARQERIKAFEDLAPTLSGK